jgi:hypothetical protein
MVSTAQKLVRNWSLNSLDKYIIVYYTKYIRFDKTR